MSAKTQLLFAYRPMVGSNTERDTSLPISTRRRDLLSWADVFKEMSSSTYLLKTENRSEFRASVCNSKSAFTLSFCAWIKSKSRSLKEWRRPKQLCWRPLV